MHRGRDAGYRILDAGAVPPCGRFPVRPASGRPRRARPGRNQKRRCGPFFKHPQRLCCAGFDYRWFAGPGQWANRQNSTPFCTKNCAGPRRGRTHQANLPAALCPNAVSKRPRAVRRPQGQPFFGRSSACPAWLNARYASTISPTVLCWRGVSPETSISCCSVTPSR